MEFAKFMASPTGRGARILVGAALIAWGLFFAGGFIPVVIGLIPLLAGVFDVCLLAPLFGAPFAGRGQR